MASQIETISRHASNAKKIHKVNTSSYKLALKKMNCIKAHCQHGQNKANRNQVRFALISTKLVFIS